MKKSVLYVRLPCWKIYPGGLISIADYVHKRAPEIEQHIIDLSLVHPLRRGAYLKKAIEEFSPDVIAFSWRNIQTFSPHDGTPALESVLKFDYSKRFGDRVSSVYKAAMLVSDFVYHLLRNRSYIALAKRMRPGAEIVVGGTGFSCFPEELIRTLPKGTIGIIGEGERGMLKVLTGEPLDRESVVYMEGGRLVRHFSHGFMDLSSATQTDFSYISSIFPEFPGFIDDDVGVQTKRGCPFSCNFCIYNVIEGRPLRCRPAWVVAEEVKTLHKRFGVKRLWFTDSQFISSEKYLPLVEETLERIISARVDISWTGYIRVEKISERLAAKMIESGIRSFDLTFTGSQRIIDNLELNYDLNEQMEAFEKIKTAGFSSQKIKLYLPLNSPGETPDTLRETISACRRLYGIFGRERVYPWIFFLAIQRGTRLERKLIDEGYLSPDYNPLSYNPFVIKKLLYNPPPLGPLIGRAYLEARRRLSGEEADRRTLDIIDDMLSKGPKSPDKSLPLL